MKLLLTVLSIIACANVGDARTPVASVTFYDHNRTAEAFAKGAALVTAPDMIVQGSHRDVAGQVVKP